MERVRVRMANDSAMSYGGRATEPSTAGHAYATEPDSRGLEGWLTEADGHDGCQALAVMAPVVSVPAELGRVRVVEAQQVGVPQRVVVARHGRIVRARKRVGVGAEVSQPRSVGEALHLVVHPTSSLPLACQLPLGRLHHTASHLEGMGRGGRGGTRWGEVRRATERRPIKCVIGLFVTLSVWSHHLCLACPW